MFKSLAIASITAFMVFGVPALAYADHDHGHGGSGNSDSDDHHGAPEPLTIIGLALGAGGIVCARWAVSRRAKNK